MAWLTAAATRRRRPDLLDDARRLVTTCVERADRNGRYLGPYANERIHDPTFFTGASGVGYALLRLADPTLPCVTLVA